MFPVTAPCLGMTGRKARCRLLERLHRKDIFNVIGKLEARLAPASEFPDRRNTAAGAQHKVSLVRRVPRDATLGAKFVLYVEFPHRYPAEQKRLRRRRSHSSRPPIVLFSLGYGSGELIPTQPWSTSHAGSRFQVSARRACRTAPNFAAGRRK